MLAHLKRLCNNNNIKYLAINIWENRQFLAKNCSILNEGEKWRVVGLDLPAKKTHFLWQRPHPGDIYMRRGQKVWRRKTLQNRGFVVGGADLLEKLCYADFGLFQGFSSGNVNVALCKPSCYVDVTVSQRHADKERQIFSCVDVIRFKGYSGKKGQHNVSKLKTKPKSQIYLTMFLISNSSNCIKVKTKTPLLFFSEKACPPYNSCYHASEEIASMPVYSGLSYDRVQITTMAEYKLQKHCG